MKLVSALLLLFYSMSSLGQSQETTIRILGVYPISESYDSLKMKAQLQQIASTWNDTGLPSSSATTVTLLNLAVPVPVNYALPGTISIAAQTAHQDTAIRALRNAWQADVIILFAHRPNDLCGAAGVAHWIDGTANFVPNSQGLDLRRRNYDYVAVVDPNCYVQAAAHELGHLGGGGHATSQFGLYHDAKASVSTYYIFPDPEVGIIESYGALGTDLADRTDAPYPIDRWGFYSDGAWDAAINNKRSLATTARSLANYYEYPQGPQVLNPPINLWGMNFGCQSDGSTRHDIYWSNDPNTNVELTHYEVWNEQPLGSLAVYCWTVYSEYTPSWVSGVTAQATVKACSGPACSARSLSYYLASPQACNW